MRTTSPAGRTASTNAAYWPIGMAVGSGSRGWSPWEYARATSSSWLRTSWFTVMPLVDEAVAIRARRDPFGPLDPEYLRQTGTHSALLRLTGIHEQGVRRAVGANVRWSSNCEPKMNTASRSPGTSPRNRSGRVLVDVPLNSEGVDIVVDFGKGKGDVSQISKFSKTLPDTRPLFPDRPTPWRRAAGNVGQHATYRLELNRCL